MKKLLFIAAFVALMITVVTVNAADLIADETLRGRIVLEVEKKGEAWYIDPETGERNFLGKPADAFKLMKAKGLGITAQNLGKIPMGLSMVLGPDTDGDKLTDAFEKAIGSDPAKKDTDGDGYSDYDEVRNGFPANIPMGNPFGIDVALVKRMRGRILLQVESRGEAWYVNPADGKRYFLGGPADAFGVMKQVGLGVKSSVLEKNTTVPGKTTTTNKNTPAAVTFDFTATAPTGWKTGTITAKYTAKYIESKLEKTFSTLFTKRFDAQSYVSEKGFIRVFTLKEKTQEEAMAMYIAKGVKFFIADVKVAGEDAKQTGVMYPKNNNYRQVVTVVPIENKKSLMIILGTNQDNYDEMKKVYDAFLTTVKLK